MDRTELSEDSRHEVGRFLRARQRVAAQRPHRPLRLLQPIPRQAAGALQGGEGHEIAGTLLHQQARALQLHGQRRQRVGEDVVDLAGDARDAQDDNQT